MSIKRTRTVCAAALAATMALSTSPLAFAQTASTSPATDQYANMLTVMSVVEQAVQTAGNQVADKAEPAMDTIAGKIIAKQEKAAKKAEAAKASKVTKVLDTANSLKGTPYVYGGSTPSGFDCSGFTMYCYAKSGVSLTHNAQAQFNQTKSVSTASMKAGDLVFFGSSTGSITHVGIYVGDGKFIHSPQTGEFVREDSLSSRSNFVGATRVIS